MAITQYALTSRAVPPRNETPLQVGEEPFDIAFAMRVGALDGRHPELEKRAMRQLKAVLKLVQRHENLCATRRDRRRFNVRGRARRFVCAAIASVAVFVFLDVLAIVPFLSP